jgi:hypothetical protein
VHGQAILRQDGLSTLLSLVVVQAVVRPVQVLTAQAAAAQAVY